MVSSERTPLTNVPKFTHLDPATVYGAVFWGIVAGLLTSALIFFLGLILTKILIPWYQQLIYSGIDLQGLWVSEKTLGGVLYHYQMRVKQRAHQLAGTMILTKSGAAAGNYVQSFTLVGSTWEGFLTLNLRSDDRKSLSFVTSLLQVTDRGATLTGYMAYRGRSIDKVESEDIQWKRG